MVKVLKNFIKFFAILLFILLIAAVYFGWQYIWAPNITIKDGKTYLYIPTGSSFSDVCNMLDTSGYIRNIKTFKWLAQRKDYPQHVRAGRYRLRNGMNNNELINMLRAGKQEPVTLVLRKYRFLSQIASHLGKNLEPDSAQFIQVLTNRQLLEKFQLNPQTVLSIFIPNTYFVFWNTTETELLERMIKEFDNFWDSTRINKARSIGLTPIEVITLASIVDEESNIKDEYPIIAGVYINRLKRGMPLQADPTVRYAIGDFQMKRVLLKHLSYSSPYNTYLNTGLPPGPICTPSQAAIDGVLNYTSHNYLYFCAKPDFSGRHAFARTLSEHNKNAIAYQRALRHLLKKQREN
ncbi:MAG: endolytic transglycosylase MltG [Bacteroidales bacterium]|nr:endolytic transglycosylase MltG [Bacteroidales bacterium]